MSHFQSIRAVKTCLQNNVGTCDVVFPLLCPVREKDWIDGWDYTMIYSVSGVAEKGCVFSTTAPDGQRILWYINEHDPINYRVAFTRMTTEMVVVIDINLAPAGENSVLTTIVYEYTSLSVKASAWIRDELDTAFTATMNYWEKAINHYLLHGAMLKKSKTA